MSGQVPYLPYAATYGRMGSFHPTTDSSDPTRLGEVRITWDQGLKITDAASPPYRWVFRMQLHCGWGIGEFFEWNRLENWEAARKALQAYPVPEYYRFEFQGRKSNDQPFHTLIPSFVLQEIFDSTSDFPLRTSGGQVLNQENYHNAK